MKRKKKAAAGAAVALALALGLAVRARAKPTTEYQVLTGYAAKETCSCVFVVEQSDDYCNAFGQVEGFNVDLAIDHDKKSVGATFLGSSVRSAHFTDGQGCVLDARP